MTIKVCVVGAGISGLAASVHLIENSKAAGHDVSVSILESSPRVGGAIETIGRDGCLLESGPDSFITDKPQALQWAKHLGLEPQIISTNPRFQQSFVVRDNLLWPTPEGFYLLAPSRLGPMFRTRLLSWPGKIRAAAEMLLPPRRDVSDESLGSFVRRRFGTEVLDRLAQPMVAGIYSADPEQLSLRATFPRFLEMEKNGGVIRSLLKARRQRRALPPIGTSGPRYGLFASLHDGMESMVKAAVAKLPTGTVRTGAKVVRLKPEWQVELADGSTESFDAVILALPSPVSASLLRGVDETLARWLSEIPYGDVTTVNLAYRREQVGHPLNGFGFVVPSLEKKIVTGCTFSSVKFADRAPEGTVVLRAFVGGNSEIDDASLVARVVKELAEFLGIKAAPLWSSMRRYPASMPHYTVGHINRVENIFHRLDRYPSLALAGNAFRGIGLPDCIASGRAAAERGLAGYKKPSLIKKST